MATRYSSYVMKDGSTRLGQDYFNPIFKDLDTRLDKMENLRISWEAAVQDLNQFGLERINTVLAPVIESTNAALDNAANLVAELEQIIEDADLEGDFAAQTASVITLLETQSAEVEAALESQSTEVDGDISALQSTVNSEISSLQADVAADIAGVQLQLSNAADKQSVVQASHGLSLFNVVRKVAGVWVKARANLVSTSIDCWTVVAVSDANNFTVQFSGVANMPGHGLTVGSVYYLSADTSGLLTSQKPVGNGTRGCLGFYLPVLYVQDSANVHFLGKGIPELNPIYAEEVFTSGTNKDVTFGGLDLDAVGGEVEILTSFSGNNTTSMRFRNSGYGATAYTRASSWLYGSAVKQESSSTDDGIRVASFFGSGANKSISKGTLTKLGSNQYIYGGTFQTESDLGSARGTFGGVAIEDIRFTGTNSTHDAGSYYRLKISRLPEN